MIALAVEVIINNALTFWDRPQNGGVPRKIERIYLYIIIDTVNFVMLLYTK